MDTKINNGENRTNVEYFKPLLQQFISKNRNLYEESGYPYGIFIPYTLPNYVNAPVKILYAGRDTYYWTDKSVMMNCYDNNRLEDYFAESQLNITVEKSLNWKNSAGAFWSFVDKLHLFVRTGKICDLTNLSDKEIEILKEIGYGNINCMEVNKTLFKNEGRDRADFDIDKLSLLRRESRVFDNIEHILKAYNPDFIVILNWEDRDDYFGNIKFKWHEDLYIDKKRAVYTLEGYDTKIIWGSHPNRFKFLSENQESMINNLGSMILKLMK